jgi:hypothetical protein
MLCLAENDGVRLDGSVTRKTPENGTLTKQNLQGFLATPADGAKLYFAPTFKLPRPPVISRVFPCERE